MRFGMVGVFGYLRRVKRRLLEREAPEKTFAETFGFGADGVTGLTSDGVDGKYGPKGYRVKYGRREMNISKEKGRRMGRRLGRMRTVWRNGAGREFKRESIVIEVWSRSGR